MCAFRVLPGLANKQDWANTFGGLTWAAAATSVCCCCHCCCCYCLATHLSSSSSSVITTMTPKKTPHLEAFVMRESRFASPRLALSRLALELKKPRSFSRVGNTRAALFAQAQRSVCLCSCDKAVSRCPLYPRRLWQDCHPARWLISLDMFLNSIKRLKLPRPQTRRAARLALALSLTPPLSLFLSLFIFRSQLLVLLVAAAVYYY